MHRVFNIALCTATLAAALLFIGPAMDAQGTNRERAQREFRRDLQAAQFCREQFGEASYQWAESGELVCIPRHGKKVVASFF